MFLQPKTYAFASKHLISAHKEKWFLFELIANQ